MGRFIRFLLVSFCRKVVALSEVDLDLEYISRISENRPPKKAQRSGDPGSSITLTFSGMPSSESKYYQQPVEQCQQVYKQLTVGRRILATTRLPRLDQFTHWLFLFIGQQSMWELGQIIWIDLRNLLINAAVICLFVCMSVCLSVCLWIATPR